MGSILRSEIELAHVGPAAERLGIDPNGLGRVERAAVELLLACGRSLGREALAARLGVDFERSIGRRRIPIDPTGIKIPRRIGPARTSAWRELDELAPGLWGTS